MNFRDYFSRQASGYTRYRPHYPAALFEYLAGLTDGHESAWDCGTGSGQAALGLTPYFEQIIATDASEKQIAHAMAHSKISYAVAPAEKTRIETNSVDLIVVAQALHWFNFDAFYAEARRVSKSGGVVAVWCYSLLRISPAIDKLLHKFYTEVLGPFWPPERKLVDDKYQTVTFPFRALHAPQFEMEVEWSFEHLMGYLGTWSAVQRYKDRCNVDPAEIFAKDLEMEWGRLEAEKRVCWPIHMRVGIVGDA
jgi:SAM-dependent methyltransferase